MFYSPSKDPECVKYWPDAALFRRTWWRFAWVKKTDAKHLDVWAYRYVRILGPLWWKDEWLGSHSDLVPTGCMVIMLVLALCAGLGVGAGFWLGWEAGVAIGAGLMALVLFFVLYMMIQGLLEIFRWW
jgi:hypothetical protein